MSYRRLVLLAFSIYFAVLLWRVVTAETRSAETLAWTLVLGICVVLMLPETRFKVKEMLEGIGIWRGSKDGEL